MPTSKPNPVRRELEHSRQGVLFQTGAYGGLQPAAPGAAEPGRSLPPGHPEPPKAVMLATDTRDEAHREHQSRQDATRAADPLGLSKRERQYYDVVDGLALQGRDATTAEVGAALGVPVNRLTQACLKLRELGLLTPTEKRRCRATGSMAQAYRIRPRDPRFSENPCVRLFGWGPAGRTCKTCELLYRKNTGSNTYLKCSLRRDTNGAGSDHKAGWPACSKHRQQENAKQIRGEE